MTADILQPLWIFRGPAFDIQIVPRTAAARARLKAQAKKRHQSLSDFCQDEIATALVFAEF
ncbi:MAG: hypothetical protein WAK31_22460 [Chthoniobacterales bacterium]